MFGMAIFGSDQLGSMKVVGTLHHGRRTTGRCNGWYRNQASAWLTQSGHSCVRLLRGLHRRRRGASAVSWPFLCALPIVGIEGSRKNVTAGRKPTESCCAAPARA